MGHYHSDELGTDYRLEMENGRLVLRHRKLDPRTLVPTFRDAFAAGGRQVVFTRDAGSRIDGYRLSDGRVWNVRFERVTG